MWDLTENLGYLSDCLQEINHPSSCPCPMMPQCFSETACPSLSLSAGNRNIAFLRMRIDNQNLWQEWSSTFSFLSWGGSRLKDGRFRAYIVNTGDVLPGYCRLIVDSRQWLICKKISVGTPSAEGARIEAPQAPRVVGCGEGVSPSPPGEGSGEGAICPLSRKILIFSSQNGEFWCNMKCYLQRFTACFYTQIETSTAHSTLS